MAFPPIIQKILDIRLDVKESNESWNAFAAALVKLSNGQIRLSRRLLAVELTGGAEFSPGIDLSGYNQCDPAGYELPGGGHVAPLTIVKEGQNPPDNAAITMVVSDV